MYEFQKDSFGYVIIRQKPEFHVEESTFLEMLKLRLQSRNFDLLGYFYEDDNNSKWYATTISSISMANEVFYS